MELERQTVPVVIVGHQALLRCLFAYFLDTPLEEPVGVLCVLE